MEFLIVLALAVLLVNGLGAYIWYRLNNVVYDIGGAESFMGEHSARLYTQYLFIQITSGKYSLAPRMETIGNPEADIVIRSVKASDEFGRIQVLAGYIRGLPINWIALFV